MKKILLLVFILISHLVKANMASPIIPGTIMASPFTSQYVDILGEKILIKIDEGFFNSKFEIEYRIKSSATGHKIPLLFYAIDYNDNFKVWIDGKKIPIKKLPESLELKDSILLSDFYYIFQDTTARGKSLSVKEDLVLGEYASIYDLLYFEADITEGEHVIKVEYDAIAEIDGSDWVNQYTFRYVLSPAKYWKSFGGLELSIDASAFDGDISFNLDTAYNCQSVSIANWEFNKLPDEPIVLSHTPKIPPFAQTLINITPGGIALIISILCIIIHLIVMILYRKKNLQKRFSFPMIIGSLTIPLIFVLTNIYAYDFIDSLLTGASGYHGYVFLTIFLYPILLPFYFLVMWLTDRIYRRTLLKKSVM